MILNKVIVGITLLLMGIASSMAQSTGDLAKFPEHPVRIIVTAAPGGSSDMLSRTLANKLTQMWGQPVVVENVAGASGNIGMKRAANAEPDGYTLVISGSGLTLNVALKSTFYQDLGFDQAKAFAAVTQAVTSPQLLVARPGLGVKTFSDYIALAKKKDGALIFGHSGYGSISHIAHELIAYQTGIKFTSVPHKSGAFSIAALMGDHVDAIIITMADLAPHVRSGRLSGIAVTTKNRSKILPDVPTLAESGLKGYDLASWQGYFVPVKTPRPIIDKLYRDFARVLKTPEINKFLDDQGFNVTVTTPTQTDKLVSEEIARFTQVVKAANIKVEQ